jgi:UDP-N-acetylmuramate: L-alanyl-gamma-D-glutamyl-meso-diaminopimelate ligase
MTAPDKRPFPDLPDEIETIHIIGICGTAMGSLAAMLTERGFTVRGSDANAYPPMSTWLAERGIEIMIGYDESNLDWNPDLVIVGNVSRATYGDAVATRERGFPYLSLPEALRYFFFEDRRSLVITGTHGKTTTTSLLAWIMTDAGRDPGFMLGGIAGNFDSNYRLGEGEIFVIEGDEYDTAYFDKVPKFWHYAPFRATINNIEFDHADIYDDLADVEHVFRRLSTMVPSEGSLWVNGDDEVAMAVSQDSTARRRTFGLGSENDLRAYNIERAGRGTRFDVSLDGQELGSVELPTMGIFNVRNALGATAIAMDEGVPFAEIQEALARFKSVKKRQPFVGGAGGVDVYDDFAHHPTAVAATLRALRDQFPERTLWALFEATSNTSRRKVFQNAYPPAFSVADQVILSSPRKKKDNLSDEERVDIAEMARTIESMGPRTRLIPDVDDIVTTVAEEVEPGDLIVGLSGASFGGVHQKLVTALKKRFNEE